MSSSAVDVDKSPFGDGDVFVDSDDGDVDGVRDDDTDVSVDVVELCVCFAFWPKKLKLFWAVIG